jgi:hypothetical protein
VEIFGYNHDDNLIVDKSSLKRAIENIAINLDKSQTERIKSSRRIKDLKITHKAIID